MDVAPGLTATVATPVSEDVAGRQLLKSGAGTLVLSGNLSHTGVTTVINGGGKLVLSGNNVAATGGMSLNGGVTQFDSPASINGTLRDVTVNTAGTVAFGSSFPDANIPAALAERIVATSAGTIAADNHAATNFDLNTPGLTGAYLGAVGNVTYTGTLTPNGNVYRLGGGGGTITMADANAVTGAGKSLMVGEVGSGGTVVLANSNNYDGGTTLNYAATLAVGNDNALGSGTLAINGGVIRSADSTAHNLPNALAFSNDTYGDAWNQIIVAGTGDMTFSNTSDTPLSATTATRYFTINNPNSTFAQAFSGTGSDIVKAGPGTLILSGANTYTAGTTIREGILRLGANNVMPDANSTTYAGGKVTVGGRKAGVTATLDLNGYDDTIGTLTFSGSGSTNGGVVTTGAGTLTLGGDPNNAVTYSNTNNPLGATISGRIGLAPSITGTRIFTVNDSTTAAIDLTVSANISGACGLTKAGAGTMVISGNMSHTGVTAVSAGKLFLSGDNSAATGGMSLTGGVTQFESPASINGTTRNVAVKVGAVAVFGSPFGDANIPAALSRITTDSAGVIAADNHETAGFDFETAGLTDAFLGAIGNVTYTGTLTPNSTGGYRLGGGGGTLTYGQVLSGSGVILTVGGNVVLPGANTYDGGTILKAGTLGVGNDGALGDGPVLFDGGGIASSDGSAHVLANPLLLNSNVTVGGTGNLTFSDTTETPLEATRTFTITNPTATFAQAFSGSGYGIIKAGTGTMVLSGACTYNGVTFISGGTLVTAGSNSSNGDTTVSAGTLQLGSATNGGLAGGTLFFGSTTTTGSVIQAVNADRTIANNTVLNNAFGVVSGSQSIEITGTFTHSLGNRTLTNNLDSGKTLTLAGQVNLSEHATTGRILTVAGTGSTIIGGAVVNGATGAGGLTMSGTGTLALTNVASTYTGVTNVSAGTLIVSKLADGGSASSIGASAVADTNLLLGNGVTLKYTGGGDSTDRQFRFNGNLAGLSITLDASGTGPINFTTATGPSHSNADQTRTLNLTGSNTGDNTLAANIGDNGAGLLSVVKSGDGTWVLSGANTYTGATTINNGTLKVNGTLAAGSAVTVAGGTLGGAGVIAGPVTVEAGGKLAPGASAGPLSTGPVTMAANSIYEWQIGSSAADKVVVTGNLTLTTGWKLSLASDGGTKPAGGVEYDLFTYTGDFTAGSTILAAITQPSDWPIATINQDTTAGAGRIYLKFGQPGDTNEDGVVDAADYITLKKNFGAGVGGGVGVGNFDESGTVNWADLQILTTNFGAGSTAPATTPEPCSAMLLVFGAAALLRRRRK
jgi:fibronectin-binding autotransporter adhesin